ncbi:hypothetical protein CJP72_06360 [Citrobacter sp. NCU1]|uniref:hypothetical protein n=1 Tax=Citrobacter sp. NCU1 TaxID=2026683 RepID=UPI001390D28A|nr:hypothetical protein [Citrobacter sp. NCU1]NDO80411.1 hypothetical protein [Citrobacter sp. NCU1]
MNIKRYEMVEKSRGPERFDVLGESADGSYVNYDDHVAVVAEMEARCAALAAENAGLKEYRPQPGGAAMMEALDAFEAQDDYPEGGMMDAFEILCCKQVKTPSTDAFLAEVLAQGVEGAIEIIMIHMNHQHHAIGTAINILRTHAAQLRQEAK